MVLLVGFPIALALGRDWSAVGDVALAEAGTAAGREAGREAGQAYGSHPAALAHPPGHPSLSLEASCFGHAIYCTGT